MSSPLVWPTQTFFYPIGNTPAVCLTQDLPPGQSADVLLLGCGDARNVLYTVYADLPSVAGPRMLDFTCCDFQPAILARNILLYILVAENEPIDKIWNIYYHLFIDEASLDLLVRHCETLLSHSNTVEEWHQCKYGSWLKVLDGHTLAQVRECWLFYTRLHPIDPAKDALLRNQLKEVVKKYDLEHGVVVSAARSAGPLMSEAVPVSSDLFHDFWKSGTTCLGAAEIREATIINPMFVYSLEGERFEPHYGTFPLQSFHLAGAFVADASASAVVGSKERVVRTAREQFSAWCSRFRQAADPRHNTVVIRFYIGEALAFCTGLLNCAKTGSALTPVYASTWTSRPTHLDQLIGTGAPTSFDVIDTSNLTDHLGLLNVLLATEPLVKFEGSSVVYTETLLRLETDAVQSMVQRICGDPQVMATFIGLAPRPLLTGFQANSNGHELMLRQLTTERGGQYHERVSWVRPSSGDNARDQVSSLLRDASGTASLAELCFDMYDKILGFEHTADMLRAQRDESRRTLRAQLQSKSTVHYTRRTFAHLLKHVRERIRFSDVNWGNVMDLFLTMAEEDKSRMVGMNFIQDLYLQLHLHGLHTTAPLGHAWTKVPAVGPPPPEIFRGWIDIPPVVCLAMNVPRSALQPLLDPALEIAPTLQIQLATSEGHSNTFASIHGLAGKIVPSVECPVLKGEGETFRNAKSFVFWCWVPTWLLTFSRSQVSLVIQTTPQTVLQFVRQLGNTLSLHTVPLMDADSVQVLRSPPNLPSELSALQKNAGPRSASLNDGLVDVCIVNKKISSFNRRLDIIDAEVKAALSNRAAVSHAQIGPCTIEVSIDQFKHTADFPYPVIGTRCKLRIARTSGYIEVIVPPAGPFPPGGYHLNPFPVHSRHTTAAWGLPATNLDLLPPVNARDTKRRLHWLNPHISLQMSDRERALRESGWGQSDALVSFKESMHALCVRFTGLQGGPATRAFGLLDPDGPGIHTIVLVNQLRLDLAAFTVVLDAAIIPLDRATMPHLKTGLQALTSQGNLCDVVTPRVEAEMWRKYLPAAVERCRTWSHKEGCKYNHSSNGKKKIPISTELDQTCICYCGRGVSVHSFEALYAMPSWKYLKPYATRAAIGPLFSVSYIESVGASLSESVKNAENIVKPPPPPSGASDMSEKCGACGGAGKPRLLTCSRCKVSKYCSAVCQRTDWKVHKQTCKC